MKVNFKYCILFCHKNNKKQIIRVSSLSIISVELSFKSVYPTTNLRKFQFLEDVLASQNIAWDIFTHMLPPAQPSPLTPFIVLPLQSPAVTNFLQVLSSPLKWPWLWILGYSYFIWFAIFCKYIGFCHIAR